MKGESSEFQLGVRHVRQAAGQSSEGIYRAYRLHFIPGS